MKTTKKLNRNRSLRIESLEERELLAVYTVNDLSDNLDVGYDSDIGYYYENPDTYQEIPAGSKMTLRMAIYQANRTTADDTINFNVTGTINNSWRFRYTSNYYIGGVYIDPGLLTINGNNVTINASQQVGVMFFSNANLTLSNMTITGSANGTYTIQHAVAYDDATMTLNNVTLKNNDSWYDVIRIESGSKMFLNKCTITDNLATGVGNNGGTLTINDCTITNNTREDGPGGISTASYSKTTIHRSVIAGNSYTGVGAGTGGGIDVGLSNTVNIYNSLIVGNYSAKGGGGIHQLGGTLKIVNSTIAGNYGTYAGGVYSYSTIEMRNTIVSRNIGTNFVYHYDSDYTGSNNLVDTDPKFIKYNSYSTWTKDLWKSWDLHLQSSSPAINKGSNSYTAGVTTDLDGKTRVIGGTVDIGAYEYVGSTPSTVGTPTNFKAVQSGKNVVLTWSAASNAKTYRISRWNDVTKKWVDLSKACTKLTLTNSNVTPGTHKYLLRAYNGTSYGNSVTVSINVKGTTAAVGTPANFKAVQSGKNVVLTWSAASNAKTYRISRWNDVTKKWVDLSKACTKLTLTNSNVTPGTHKYLLRAYNGTSYGNSVTVSINVKETTAVGTPSNFKAVQSGKNVVLTWSAASNAATYRIGRWNDVTKKWVDLSKACTKLTLTNNNVTPGTHKYLLRAYNGTSYGNSVTVSITVKGTTAAVGTPANFKAVQSGKNVVLTWSAAGNAATYRIGRWNDVTKKWVDLSKACTKLTLTNNNVTPGTHKYLLRAYNGNSYGNSVTVSINVKRTASVNVEAALSPLEAVFAEYGAEYENVYEFV